MQMQPPGPAATTERLALPAWILKDPVQSRILVSEKPERHGDTGAAAALSAILSLCRQFYQRYAVHMDKTAAEWNWGLRGPGLSTLLGGLVRFLCVFLLLWPPAPSSRSHHTQRRSSDGAVAAALVSGQYLETSLSCIIHAEQSGFNI